MVWGFFRQEQKNNSYAVKQNWRYLGEKNSLVCAAGTATEIPFLAKV